MLESIMVASSCWIALTEVKALVMATSDGKLSASDCKAWATIVPEQEIGEYAQCLHPHIYAAQFSVVFLQETMQDAKSGCENC